MKVLSTLETRAGVLLDTAELRSAQSSRSFNFGSMFSGEVEVSQVLLAQQSNYELMTLLQPI